MVTTVRNCLSKGSLSISDVKSRQYADKMAIAANFIYNLAKRAT